MDVQLPCFDLVFEPSDLDKEEKEKRFVQLSKNEVERIEGARLEASTKRATKWGVQIFKGQSTSYAEA